MRRISRSTTIASTQNDAITTWARPPDSQSEWTAPIAPKQPIYRSQLRTLFRRFSKRYQIVVADDGVGLLEDVTWPVPGKLGALILQSLRENVETGFKVESARGNGMRVTINFVHKAPLNKAT